MTARVVVDTNVFTAWLGGSRSPLALQYTKHLVGQQFAVSPQTVAEARYGALKAGWGPKRLREVEQMTSRVGVLDVDGETTEAVAQLRNQCRLIGHALHQRLHNADLWIAAAAIRWNLPLVAHDAVFISCPGLDLRTGCLTRGGDARIPNLAAGADPTVGCATGARSSQHRRRGRGGLPQPLREQHSR